MADVSILLERKSIKTESIKRRKEDYEKLKTIRTHYK
jgi:hypothetical protein